MTKSAVDKYGSIVFRSRPSLSMCVIRFHCLAPTPEAQKSECPYYESPNNTACVFRKGRSFCGLHKVQLNEVAFALKCLIDEDEPF